MNRREFQAALIHWAVLTRLLMLGVLFAGTLAVPHGRGPWVSFLLYAAANLVFLLLVLLHRHRDTPVPRSLWTFHYVLLLLETCFEGVLVLSDGGYTSDFSLLFVLTGTLGGFLFRTSGALGIIGVIALIFGVLGLAHLGLAVPGVSVQRQGWSETVFRYGMVVGSGGLVSLLTGYLRSSLQLHQETIVGQARDLELARLDLDGVLNRVTYGVLVLDPAETLVYFNRAAGEHFEAPLQPGIAMARPLSRESWGTAARELCQRVIQSGEEQDREIRTDDGRWLRLQAAGTWVEGALRHLVVTVHDISHIRRMEEEVRNSERMSTLGHMAARIAHEIRNPLASITGSAQLLTSPGAAGNAEDAQLLALIRRESERLNRILAEFLDFSRPRIPQPRLTSINQMIEEVADTVRARAVAENRPDVRCECSIEAELEVLVDRDMLVQVLLNLALNAYQAIPVSKAGIVRLEVIPKGRSLRLRVRDDGVGMRPEVLSKAGEVFFTTKQGGVGLGLAICRQLVAHLGGTFRVQSLEGRGTVAEIVLPLLDESSHRNS